MTPDKPTRRGLLRGLLGGLAGLFSLGGGKTPTIEPAAAAALAPGAPLDHAGSLAVAGESVTSVYHYDGLGRVIRCTDMGGPTTSIVYDTGGNSRPVV
jgi:YD repeat-containing protein